MEGQALSELLEAIYEAPFQGVFSGALLERLNRAVGSEVAVLIEQDPRTAQARTIAKVGLGDAAIGAYEDYYASRSVLLRESADYRAVGAVFADHMARDYRAYLGSEAYADYFRPNGMDHLVQAHLHRAGNWVTALALRRPRRRGAYRPEELERFRLLVPHLVNAVRHARIVERHVRLERGLTALLEELNVATVVLDEGDRLMFANGLAEQTLSGGALRIRERRLVARSAGDDAGLDGLLRRARQHDGPGVGAGLRLVLGAGQEPLLISAMPLVPRQGAAFGHERPGALIVFLSRARRQLPDGRLLALLFGLTTAETEIAQALYGGLTVARIAERRSTSEAAVRYHVKNLFQKMNVSRQSELVRLIASAPALLFLGAAAAARGTLPSGATGGSR